VSTYLYETLHLNRVTHRATIVAYSALDAAWRAVDAHHGDGPLDAVRVAGETWRWNRGALRRLEVKA
jgi:hypothetical protein